MPRPGAPGRQQGVEQLRVIDEVPGQVLGGAEQRRHQPPERRVLVHHAPQRVPAAPAVGRARRRSRRPDRDPATPPRSARSSGATRAPAPSAAGPSGEAARRRARSSWVWARWGSRMPSSASSAQLGVRLAGAAQQRDRRGRRPVVIRAQGREQPGDAAGVVLEGRARSRRRCRGPAGGPAARRRAGRRATAGSGGRDSSWSRCSTRRR